MQRAGARLVAAQEGRADLHRRRAERHRRAHAGRVGDATGSDHRDVQRRDELRQQRQRAALPRRVGVEEVAAVAAGLQPLGDHRVGAVRLQPLRLAQRRRRRQHARAEPLDPREQLRRRQPEVEAHQRRPEGLQHLGRRRAERLAARRRDRRGRIEAQLGVIRRQRGPPARLGRGGCLVRRRHVGEEVDEIGPPGVLQRLQLTRQRRRVEHRRRQRPHRAGLADRPRQPRALRAGHRRLDQRPARAEKGVHRTVHGVHGHHVTAVLPSAPMICCDHRYLHRR